MALTLPLAATIVLLVVLSAFFSLTEASFLAMNKVRLRHLVNRGSTSAKCVYQLLTQLDRLIATILVGNTIVNVAISVMATVLFVGLFGPREGLVIATIGLTVILLVFGEITPKLFAARHADRTALLLVWPLKWMVALMQPLVWIFTRISNALIYVLGEHRLPRSPLVTEEELKVMIEMGREAGVLAESELRMLQRIFEFSDSLVQEIMVPREEIAAVDLSANASAALDLLIEEGHSRIPVYRGSLDHIVGVIYARDLLAMIRHEAVFVLADLIRPVVFVPSDKRVAELLSDFQRLKSQIAIVQDARQTTMGLVTIEDLLEELVGEIHEEVPPASSANA